MPRSSSCFLFLFGIRLHFKSVDDFLLVVSNQFFFDVSQMHCCFCFCLYIWNHHHHHHHVVLVARVFLTLSRHFSLSFIASGRSSGQHPVSSHSCWMYVHAGGPAFARPCVGVHKSTPLISSSLLLEQISEIRTANIHKMPMLPPR